MSKRRPEPATTGTLIRRLVAPRFGFIHSVHELELEGDDPLVFNAFARPLNPQNFGSMFAGAHVESGGAGITEEAALAAAVGETIERYALAQKPRETIEASVYDFPAAADAAPMASEQIALFSKEQTAQPGFPYPRFDDRSVVNWTKVTSIDGQPDCWYPSCLIYVPYEEDGQGDVIAPGVSTGAVCATDVGTALAKGIYECVERDSIMLHWMLGLPADRIDASRLSGFRQLFAHYFDRPWLKYEWFLLRNDFEIPVVFCLLHDDTTYRLHTVCGGAASLNLEEAMLKSTVEAAQGRCWTKYMRKRGDLDNELLAEDIQAFSDHVRYYARAPRTKELSFLRSGNVISHNESEQYAGFPAPGSRRLVAELVSRLSARGVRVLYKDLTLPDIADAGFVVAKVITPQLAGLNDVYRVRFLGSPRFEEVPRRLGRTPLYPRSSGFNPHPHPFP